MLTQALRQVPLSDGPTDAPCLVFLPGAMCPPEVCAEAAQASGLRGLGLAWLEGPGPHDLPSIAERVWRALAELPGAILVGHSMGTPIAILAALRDRAEGSSRARGLVLSNSGASTRGHGDIEQVVQRIQNEWGPVFWDSFVARCFHRPPAGALAEAVTHYPQRVTPEATIEVIRSQQATDLGPRLAALGGLPTTVVYGRHDPARTLAHAREMSDGIAGARLEALDTGHTSCAEAPAEFGRLIREVADRAAADPLLSPDTR